MRQQAGPKRHKAASPRKKGFILQRLRRQDLILLTGLLALACVSMISVGFLILRFQQSADPLQAENLGPTPTPGPQPTYTVSFVEITGLGQYQAVAAEAKSWAEDAQLVSASANWPGVLGVEQVGQPAQWSYRFYSPGKARLLIIKVETDGRIRSVEHRIQITLPPPTITTDAWLVDSPAALATWLDYGGGELIHRNPGLEVLVQLRPLNNYPNPVWMVVGTDKRTQDIRTVVIDAGAGTVVSTSSGP
jgi:hypothetical protein